MSRKTLPEAEDGLEKVYGSTYWDFIWWPALAAITGSETNEAALGKLERFKAMENGIVEDSEVVEAELMGAIVELKAQNRIFGPLPSVEDLVNPPGELAINDDPDLFKSNADIIEEVCKGVSKEGDVDDEIQECSPPQMS